LAAFLSSPANGPQAASLPPADGPLAASLPAGAYTLSLVAVRAGGDPENLADRLSNFASIFFTVSNPFQIQ